MATLPPGENGAEDGVKIRRLPSGDEDLFGTAALARHDPDHPLRYVEGFTEDADERVVRGIVDRSRSEYHEQLVVSRPADGAPSRARGHTDGDNRAGRSVAEHSVMRPKPNAQRRTPTVSERPVRLSRLRDVAGIHRAQRRRRERRRQRRFNDTGPMQDDLAVFPLLDVLLADELE